MATDTTAAAAQPPTPTAETPEELAEKMRVLAAVTAIEQLLKEEDLGGSIIIVGKSGSGTREILPPWSGITSNDVGRVRAYGVSIGGRTEADRIAAMLSVHYVTCMHERTMESVERWGAVANMINNALDNAVKDAADAAAAAPVAEQTAPAAPAPAESEAP